MPTDEPQSPLAALPSVAALFAYIAKTDGLPTVEGLLAEADLRQEMLIDAANVLFRLGLRDLGRLVRARGVKAKPTPIEALPFPLRRAAPHWERAQPLWRTRRARKARKSVGRSERH